MWVLAKGGLVCITHTPLLLNRFEVAVLTKGGEAIPNPDSLLLNRFEVSVLTKGGGKRGSRCGFSLRGASLYYPHSTPKRFEVAVLTTGGRRSQIQTTSKITTITLH